MTTATDELRKLLDERGVEWTYADGTVSFADNGRWYHAWAYNDGAMCVSMGYLTPEQAIAATLGNSRADYHGYEQAAIEAWESIKAWNSRAERTCEFSIKDNMNETEGMGDVWIECSACNCVFDYYADEWLMKMSYCPNCGARRVGE